MAASQDWKQLPRRSTSEQEAICRVDVIESKLQAKKNGRALILVPGTSGRDRNLAQRGKLLSGLFLSFSFRGLDAANPDTGSTKEQEF